MSQHVLTTEHKGRTIEVLAGWDRPLQGFFLVVSAEQGEGQEPEYIYTNLDDPNLFAFGGLPPTWTSFAARLREQGIVLPENMVDAIEADGEANAGNKLVRYDAAGQILHSVAAT